MWERENFVKKSFGSNRIECLLHELQCLIKSLKKAALGTKVLGLFMFSANKAEHGRGSTCVSARMFTRLWERGRGFISVLRVFPHM